VTVFDGVIVLTDSNHSSPSQSKFTPPPAGTGIICLVRYEAALFIPGCEGDIA
jgi:hypothetical protein